MATAVQSFIKSVAFFLLAGFLGLFAGLAVGVLFGMPDGSGLSGPPLAFGYGFIGLASGIILGIVAMNHLSREALQRITMVMGIVTLVVLIWLTHHVRTTRRHYATPPGIPVSAPADRVAPAAGRLPV